MSRVLVIRYERVKVPVCGDPLFQSIRLGSKNILNLVDISEIFSGLGFNGLVSCSSYLAPMDVIVFKTEGNHLVHLHRV